MSVEDVREFLEAKNYPDSLVPIFRGWCLCNVSEFTFVFLEQEMDGSAVKYGMGTSPGPQWLQEIVPVLGQRLKVHNDLRTLCMQDQDLELATSGQIQVHVCKGHCMWKGMYMLACCD